MTIESPTSSSIPPEKPSILEQSLDSLTIWVVGKGHPKYRAKQILSWVYHRRAASFADMTDLPKALRAELEGAFDFFRSTTVDTQDSEDGTQKLLLQLHDGGRIECVLLRDGPRRSICVSSQVGCAMGCVFLCKRPGWCRPKPHPSRDPRADAQTATPFASRRETEPYRHDGHGGTLGEFAASPRRPLRRQGFRHRAWDQPSSYHDQHGRYPASIDKLAEDRSPYHLAISLHAPNDTLRNQLVPVNKKIGIEPILAAADRYFEATGRRLTFEYVLLKDLNDSEACARELVQLLRGRTAMLNVIPYNPVPGLPYETPSPDAIYQFRRTLVDGGINVMFRQRKGNDIQAACGQLRRLRQNEPFSQPPIVTLKPSPDITSPPMITAMKWVVRYGMDGTNCLLSPLITCSKLVATRWRVDLRCSCILVGQPTGRS